MSTQPADPPLTGALLTVKTAAGLLAISERQAWRLVMSGDLESVHVGHLRRVPASAVDDYIAKLRS
jgi:excisionase family DNA binding protein